MDMQLSDEGRQRIERSEALVLIAYYDKGGVLTVGYGHTGPDVRPGMVITKERADLLLQHDTMRAVQEVNYSVHVLLTQHQFDALVDFTFNVGIGAFAGSTVLKLLNAGNYSGADAHFMDWININHVPSEGLRNRRKSEQQEFEEK